MQNYKYHRENYDIDKTYPLNIDYQAVNLIKNNSNILEIGCATGYIGKFLTLKMNCKVTGVEIDEKSAGVARHCYKNMIVGNIENDFVLNQINEKFDVVACIGILEHLVDPTNILIKLKHLIDKNGYFIITLPNIAHWTIRGKLLFGKFDYSEYGILDNTHLKFFTLKTAKEMLHKAGLEIEYFSIDPDMGIPKFNGLIRRIPIVGVKFLKFFYSLAPTIFGYQFLFKTKPITK